ncbi:MAG: TrpR-related protein YerC/YecD [Clostridia bacterium]|nr:TrpR-related protein YerC/YecD [Clostridia bacterium]
MKDTELHLNELYETLIKLNTVEDCKVLLDDLCTYKEVEQMAQRAYAAKLFLEGKTYNEIIAETDISSTTLSRISRAITHGSGGYKKFVDYNGKVEK